MSRRTVVAISLLVVGIFAGLVYYGWTHRWGGQMDTTVEPYLTLHMPQMDKELALTPEDFDDGVWQEMQPVTVRFMHQVTSVPHGKNLVPEVDIRTFHNGKEAYFLFEWKDPVPSSVHDIEKFPDAVAVALSMGKDPPVSSIMMGFESPINIWHWKANLDAQTWGPAAAERSTSNVYYTYKSKADIPASADKVTSACQDIIAIRPGTVTPKEDNLLVTGRGQWKEGAWRVIIKRLLTCQKAPL